MCGGKPLANVTLYEHVLTHFCSLVAVLEPESFEALEQLLIKWLLCGQTWPALMAADIWCFVARWGIFFFFLWEFWGGNSEILWWFFMWLFKYLPPIFKKILIDDFPAGMEQVSCVRITAWYLLKFYLMLHFIHTSSWYSLHFSQGLFPSFLQLIRLISFLTYHQVSHHGNVCMCQDMCNMLKGTE